MVTSEMQHNIIKEEEPAGPPTEKIEPVEVLIITKLVQVANLKFQVSNKLIQVSNLKLQVHKLVF